jgi:hypothetical protein
VDFEADQPHTKKPRTEAVCARCASRFIKNGDSIWCPKCTDVKIAEKARPWRWDWRTGKRTFTPAPAAHQSTHGMPNAWARGNLCRCCGQKTANYGKPGTTTRLWCGKCAKLHGGTLQCQ